MKNNALRDKVAIITGSSKGIGRATAAELVRNGAKVVLNGRNLHALKEAEDVISGKEQNRVLAIQADVTSRDECEELINRTLEAFGRIDILIANAGIAMRGKFEELNPEVLRKTMELNVLGSAYPAQFALPHLKKTAGSLVFISSIAGIRGLPYISIYSASKMALTGIVESLRFELSGSGIHVGIVYVGFTENDPDKLILGENGDLIALAPRKTGTTQSKQDTARAIVKVITKRKFKTVLSPLGKLNIISNRFFPRLSMRLIASSLDRVHTMYE